MDQEFLRFCYLIIGFLVQSKKTFVEIATELQSCLDCTMLLRGENEIIYRILLREAEARRLNLYDYLSIIKEDQSFSPQIVEIEVAT